MAAPQSSPDNERINARTNERVSYMRLLTVVERIVKYPKDVRIQTPGTREPVPACGQSDFTDVITLRILRWRSYPGSFGWIQYPCPLIRGRQEGQGRKRQCDGGDRKRLQDAMLLALTLQGVAKSQGAQVSSRSLQKARKQILP